jgi:hypothetical protein
MVDIFRKKDVTAVDRNFSKSLIQHDPNLPTVQRPHNKKPPPVPDKKDFDRTDGGLT